MFRCKRVSKALTEKRYWELPWYRRMGLRIHIFLCMVCGPYHRQVIEMQEGVKRYLTEEEELLKKGDRTLSSEARDRIRRTLRREAMPEENPPEKGASA